MDSQVHAACSDRDAQQGCHTDEICVTADPALLLQPEPLPPDALKAEGLDADHRIVGFSVREPGPAAPDIDVDHYHALLANTADFLVDRVDADIAFVPLERTTMDCQHSHAVAALAARSNQWPREMAAGPVQQELVRQGADLGRAHQRSQRSFEESIERGESQPIVWQR
jgi:hypothetical protein